MDKLPEIFRNNDCIIVLDQMTEENCGVVTQRVRSGWFLWQKKTKIKSFWRIPDAESSCLII